MPEIVLPLSPSTQLLRSKAGATSAVIASNFVARYNFFLFNLYATYITSTFFPPNSQSTTSFVTYSATFLAQPIGAIVLGGHTDQIGRRNGLITTLAIMIIGTFIIVLTPPYKNTGAAAPILVLIGRLFQGFSVGAQAGGVSVYLAETSKPGRKGFYTSLQEASTQLAVMVATGLSFALSARMGDTEVKEWGWRILFLIGCTFAPIIFVLRHSLEETDDFKARCCHPDLPEVIRTLLENWPTVLAGTMMATMTTSTFYLMTVYEPTFGRQELKLGEAQILLVTLLIAASNFVWLPAGGASSDLLGQKFVLVTMTLFALTTSYTALWILAWAPSMSMILAVLLWLSLIVGLYTGAMVPALTEVMPPQVRVAGTSLAYSLAVTLFGGPTPVIATALVEYTKDKASPGYWLSFTAVCALFGTLFLYGRKEMRSRSARFPGCF